MKIPSYFSTEPMETSRLPRAPAGLLAETGQGLEAEAMAGFGAALGRVGDILATIGAEKQRGRDNATLAGLSDQERDFVFGSYDELEQYKITEDTEIEDYGKLEKKFEKDWDRKVKELLKGQSRKVVEHFTLWSKQSRAKILRDYHNRVWQKEQSFAQGQAISIADKQLRRGDLKGALQTYEAHAQYFPPKALQGLKDAAADTMMKYQHQAFLEQVRLQAKDLPLAEALTLINNIPVTDITTAERNAQVTMRERQEEIATATTNRQVRWDTLLKLSKDPESVTDEYLLNLVRPNSLTWDDAEELRKIRDTDNHPLKRTDFKRALTTLEEIKDMDMAIAKEFGKTALERREILLLHFGLKNDLEKWIMEKDRTTEEIEKKVRSLTEPVIEKDVLNWFGRLMRPKETTPFWRHFGTTEETARAREKAKAGIVEEDLTTMTDEELEAIIEGK